MPKAKVRFNDKSKTVTIPLAMWDRLSGFYLNKKRQMRAEEARKHGNQKLTEDTYGKPE